MSSGSNRKRSRSPRSADARRQEEGIAADAIWRARVLASWVFWTLRSDTPCERWMYSAWPHVPAWRMISSRSVRRWMRTTRGEEGEGGEGEGEGEGAGG